MYVYTIISAIILVNKEADVTVEPVWWLGGGGLLCMHILLIFTWTEVLETDWKVALMAVLTFRL